MHDKLTVNVNLVGTQKETFLAAIKAAKLTVNTDLGFAKLTKETIFPVRTAVVALFRKQFALKSKTAQNLTMCFDCERIVDKIDNFIEDSFGLDIPDEPLVEGSTDEDDELVVPNELNEEEPHWLGGLPEEPSEAFKSIEAGLLDAIAYANGDETKGTVATPTKRKKKNGEEPTIS